MADHPVPDQPDAAGSPVAALAIGQGQDALAADGELTGAVADETGGPALPDQAPPAAPPADLG